MVPSKLFLRPHLSAKHLFRITLVNIVQPKALAYKNLVHSQWCSQSLLCISEVGKKISRVSDLENLEEHDKVNNARLPHHVANKMMFYGTALTELSNEEEVANIFNQNMVYEGVRLELKTKKDFDVERDNEEKEVEKNHPRSGPNSKNNSKPELDYPKDLIIAFKLKRISTESSTE
ncbi:hypothetical protein BC332_15578 [Capsicum chinense]|nr:hypothetical protein BC332_15578 [Capsicum chinense]